MKLKRFPEGKQETRRLFIRSSNSQLIPVVTIPPGPFAHALTNNRAHVYMGFWADDPIYKTLMFSAGQDIFWPGWQII